MLENKLEFIRNDGSNMRGFYKCGYCGRTVSKYKTNISRMKSCGCMLKIIHKTHGDSKNLLYTKYVFYKYKYKDLTKKESEDQKFNNYVDFKNYVLNLGYDDSKTFIRKDTKKGLVKDNILVLSKDEAILKVKRKMSVMTEEKQKRALIIYDEIKKKYKDENECVLINLVALILELSFCSVYQVIKGESRVNNEFDKRKAYKRAWYLFKKQEVIL